MPVVASAEGANSLLAWGASSFPTCPLRCSEASRHLEDSGVDSRAVLDCTLSSLVDALNRREVDAATEPRPLAFVVLPVSERHELLPRLFWEDPPPPPPPPPYMRCMTSVDVTAALAGRRPRGARPRGPAPCAAMSLGGEGGVGVPPASAGVVSVPFLPLFLRAGREPLEMDVTLIIEASFGSTVSWTFVFWPFSAVADGTGEGPVLVGATGSTCTFPPGVSPLLLLLSAEALPRIPAVLCDSTAPARIAFPGP